MGTLDRCLIGRSFLYRLILISLVIFVAGVASRTALARNPEIAVEKRDKDGDGRVGRDEWTESEEGFARIDANHDDYLTVDEFSNYFSTLESPDNGKNSKQAVKGKGPGPKPKKPQTIIKNMDKNGDGKVAREEWRGQPNFYDQIDVDRDGHLTLKELTAYFGALAGADGGKKGGGQAKDPKTMVKTMDKDGDGMIAREEWKGKAEAYDQIDADRDNRLTVAELATFFSARDNSDGKKGTKVKLMSAVKSMDENRDTMVSRDEWTGPAKQFESIDANRDGQLTVEELAAALVKQSDKDGDGKIGRDETKFPREKFDLLDKDGDGKISAKEYGADMGWGSAATNR